MGWGDIGNIIAAPFTEPLKAVTNTVTNAWNDFTGKTAADLSAKQAKENTAKQIAWERERATSAHQWEVEDLEKAGLNPILSAGGQGAATSGITPQQSDYSSISQGAQNVVNTLMQIAPMVSQLKMNSAQTAKINAEAAKTKSETAINEFIKNIKKYESENFSKYYESQISKSPKWLVDQLSKLFNWGSNTGAAKKFEQLSEKTYDLLHKEPEQKNGKLINKMYKNANPIQKIVIKIMTEAMGI